MSTTHDKNGFMKEMHVYLRICNLQFRNFEFEFLCLPSRVASEKIRTRLFARRPKKSEFVFIDYAMYRDMPNPGLEPLFWFLALGGGWPLFKNGALV